MTFWGIALKPGKTHPVQNTEGDILHLSQACLSNPKPGKNYLQVTENNSTYSIACLEKDKTEHASFDLFFSTGSCTFGNKGDSEIHLTGYFEPEQGMGDMEEDSEEEAAPVAKKSPAAAPAKSPLQKAKSPLVQAANGKAAAAESDDDDEDEEEEEEMEEEESEEEAPPAKSPAQKAAAKAPAESDDDDEEEEEESEGMEEEESEEEAAPPPAKKAKTAAPAPGSPKLAAGGDAAAGYAKQLVDFIKKQEGPTNISTIGSRCPKPKDVPMKLKAFLEANKDKFVLNGEQVTLKK